MDPKQVARRIQSLMKRHGWNQQTLAAALGVSQPAISQYLKGRIPPSQVLYRLAQLSRTSMEWILTGESVPSATAVAEGEAPYGPEATLLNLWRKLPQDVQQTLLDLLTQLVHLSETAEEK